MYTKEHARENAAIDSRAIQILLREMDFDPIRQKEMAGYSRRIRDELTERLSAEFPTVSKSRLRARVAKAMRRAAGVNIASLREAISIKVYVSSEAAAEKIREMSPRERGRLFMKALQMADD